jgi:DNA-binding response OmpR family regulator
VTLEDVGDHLLLIDDEDDVRAMLRLLLEDAGFTVSEGRDAADGLARFEEDRPDAALVDLKLPDRNGFEVTRAIRQASEIPIVIVTGQDDPFDVVAGLEAGADDYVTKPVAIEELVARLRALLRRTRGEFGGPQRWQVGDLEVLPEEGLARKGGVALDLTATEFRLLSLLASQAGRVCSRDLLLDRIWGYDHLGDSRVVDAHISRLRSKVEDDPAEPSLITTVRGVGYKLAS